MQASLRDDKKKKSPSRHEFHALTLADVLSPYFGREQLYTQDQQGFMARVRRNGKVKAWKRDPERVEIPLKFGMYEAFRVDDPAELFVMVERDFPVNLDPTPAETQEVVRRLTRRGNAPLKGARAIGANMTEVEHGDLTVLYSYETPVVFLSPKGGYVTDKFWSNTTSKHIAKFFQRHGYDKKGAHKIAQDDLARFVEWGTHTEAFGGTRSNPRPRRTQHRQRLIRDMRFFREQSGGVVGEGSRRGLDYARAEREMKRRGWIVTWEPDNDADWSWMSEEEQKRDHEVYVAVLWNTDPEESRRPGRMNATVLASLGGIFDPSPEYQRVVEAELASEALAEIQ